MKKKNIFIILFIILFSTVSIILTYKESRLSTYFLLIPTMFVPYICKIIGIKLRDNDIFWYYIFIFLAQVLGCICNLYNTVWWYDIFAHFLSGVFTFHIGLVMLDNFNNKNDSLLFKVFFCICFSAFVALMWEVVEFTGDNLFSSDVQHSLDTGVVDTMEDMIVAMIGSSLYGIFYKIREKLV